MKTMLQKIRSKPDHVKKSITLVLTVFIFTIIASVWLSSWDARQTSEISKEKTDSPLASLKLVLSGITKDIKDTYSASPDAVTEDFVVATTTPESQSATLLDASRVKVIDKAFIIATTTATTSSSIIR